MKKATLTVEAVVGIFLLVIVLFIMTGFILRIPGLGGRILSFVGGGLATVSAGIWSFLGKLFQLLASVWDTFWSAVMRGFWTAIGSAISSFIGSFFYAGAARIIIETISRISTEGLRWTLEELIRVGLPYAARGFWGALGNALTSAGISFASSLAADFIVVPWLNTNVNPVVGSAVGGVMKAGVSTLLITGSTTIAGHAIGAGLAGTLGAAMGISATAAGPLAFTALPAAAVSSIVKNHSGLTGWQGALATIGGGAATGAATGALIGSIVPGIGTVIGAAVGAVVGAIAGAFTWFFG